MWGKVMDKGVLVDIADRQRFAQENVVNTLLTYLARFQEFEDPDQMKRVVGLMHRQVVRSKAEGLYFRVSLLVSESSTS